LRDCNQRDGEGWGVDSELFAEAGCVIIFWRDYMEGMRLRLEDLQVGDTVTKSSLDNIFNVYITLVDSKVIDGDIIGKIAFIGKELGD